MGSDALALGEETDFEALNYQPSPKAYTGKYAQLTTEQTFCQTPAIGWLSI